MSEIRCHSITPTIVVDDVVATTDFYRDSLGFELGFLWGEPPTYGAVRLGETAIHFSKGAGSTEGFWLYVIVDDVDALHDRYVAAGLDVLDEPESHPWGMREFGVRDLNGLKLVFARSAPEAGEKVIVERVPLEARIEKRLAAVVADVAESKGMTVGQMLEETLLHSFEALPSGGVASPHTQQTLELIEELKQRHGLDYEAHASYRFAEEGPDAE